MSHHRNRWWGQDTPAHIWGWSCSRRSRRDIEPRTVVWPYLQNCVHWPGISAHRSSWGYQLHIESLQQLSSPEALRTYESGYLRNSHLDSWREMFCMFLRVDLPKGLKHCYCHSCWHRGCLSLLRIPHFCIRFNRLRRRWNYSLRRPSSLYSWYHRWDWSIWWCIELWSYLPTVLKGNTNYILPDLWLYSGQTSPARTERHTT